MVKNLLETNYSPNSDDGVPCRWRPSSKIASKIF